LHVTVGTQLKAIAILTRLRGLQVTSTDGRPTVDSPWKGLRWSGFATVVAAGTGFAGERLSWWHAQDYLPWAILGLVGTLIFATGGRLLNTLSSIEALGVKIALVNHNISEEAGARQTDARQMRDRLDSIEDRLLAVLQQSISINLPPSPQLDPDIIAAAIERRQLLQSLSVAGENKELTISRPERESTNSIGIGAYTTYIPPNVYRRGTQRGDNAQ
jgi:hypothetical protein